MSNTLGINQATIATRKTISHRRQINELHCEMTLKHIVAGVTLLVFSLSLLLWDSRTCLNQSCLSRTIARRGWRSVNLSCPIVFRPAQLPQDYYDAPNDTWPLWTRMIQLPDIQLMNLKKINLNMMRDPSRVLTVGILGGSMTGGASCVQGNLTMKDCAWPNRLKLQLDSYFGEDRVKVLNLARGGTQTEVAVGALYTLLGSQQSQKMDLILTDFAVNDSFEFGGNVGHSSAVYDSKDPTVLYEKAVALAELLVKGIQEICPGIIHIMILSHCSVCQLNSAILNGMKDVAINEGVGLIDARHLRSEGAKFPWIPAAATHPNFRSHQILADVVGYALLKVGFRPDCIQRNSSASVHSIANPDIKAKFTSCVIPKSQYDANVLYDVNANLNMIHGVTFDGDWSLEEDVAGKPGFISKSISSQISFEIEFGAVPTLTVLYLRSYERMGKFELTLNNHRVILHGLWNRHMSTTQVFRSQAYSTAIQVGEHQADDDNQYGIIGFSVMPNSRQNISFSNLGSGNYTKVKIVSVMTC